MIDQQEFFKMVLHEFDSVKTQISNCQADVALLHQQLDNHLKTVDKEANKNLKIKLTVFGVIIGTGTTLLNVFVF